MTNDQRIKTDCYSKDHACCVRCISWSAIIVGALVGLGLSFLLNLFGLAIGLEAFNTTQAGLTTFAIGGFIGMLIGGIVSMFVAGWVAGYLGRAYCFNRNLGTLYGFTTWCLILIVTIMLASHVSHFISLHYLSLSNPNSTVEMTDNMTNTTTAVSSNGTQTTVATNSSHTLGMSLFLMFVLFFIGALASCFGGYFGLKPRDDLYEANKVVPPKI